MMMIAHFNTSKNIDDLLLYHQLNVNSFFEHYPENILDEKLLGFYKGRVCYMANKDTTDWHAEDLLFYEDLKGLLYCAQQLSLKQKQIPCIVATDELIETAVLTPLQGVINLITSAIPVSMIFNLANADDEPDLIIVLAKGCNHANTEFDNLIELAMLGYKKGICTVHHYGAINELMRRGHIFYSAACVEKNIVYGSAPKVFCLANPALFELAKSESESLFKAGMEKAVQFYSGAQQYIKDGVYDMTIFMLHQACELTYRCLLNVLRGKDVKCHSPAVLRKHVRRFAPEVIGIFSNKEEEELYYLKILEDAYVKSRYDQYYFIEYPLIQFLNERVGLMQQTAIKLFWKKMNILEQMVNNLSSTIN